jgi:hypothetical protein
MPVAMLALGCATPIREDPPSKLGAASGANGTGGSEGSGSLASGTASTASGMGASAASSSGATDGGTGGMTHASGGSGGSGGGNTSDTSDTSDTDTETATITSSETSTSSTPSSSSTGGIPISGLPWLDNFESYPAGGQANPNWTALESDGNWSIVSDGSTKLYAPSSEASNRNMTYAGDPSWTDVRLQVDVRLGGINDNGTRIYLAVRAAPAGNKLDYYHAYLRADGRVRLGKYVGGSTDETFSEARDTGVSLDETTWHTFALTVTGDTLSAELDGVEVDSASTTGLSTGTIALGVDGGTAEFDNVSVTEP